MIKIFIVILNWNNYRDTIECLRSLEKLAIKDYQLSILVVDNKSTDHSVEKIKSYNTKLKIIRNRKNLGFAGGNNVGIKYALENKADYILVLNNDTTVDKNLLVRLVEVAKKKKRFGILSPKIYFAKGFEFYKERYKKSELGKVIWSAGGIIDWKNVYVNNRGIDEVDVGQYDKVEKIEFATGAAMFLEAKVLKKVGLFDKKYFLYLEDADLSQRMLRCGFEIYYVPKAIVYHKVGKTAGIGSNLADYFLTRNRLLFTIKYAPLRSKIAVFMESIRFCFNGRRWQRLGVRDFYLGKFGKGSYR